MRWHKAVSALIVFFLLPGKAVQATPTEYASTKIEEGMTVAQVDNAIGFLPNSAEERTCGNGDSIRLWSCRIQFYADGIRTLAVYFRKLDDKPTWVVHSWRFQ